MDCTTYRVKDYQESYTFKVEGFSKLAKDNQQVEVFPEFSLCGVTWQMRVFFAGKDVVSQGFWSVFLVNTGKESVMGNLSVTLLPPNADKKFVMHQLTRQKFIPNTTMGWHQFILRSAGDYYCANDCITFKVNAERVNGEDPTNCARFDLVNDRGFSGDRVAQSIAKMAKDTAVNDTNMYVGLAQQELLHMNRGILMARSPVFHAMFSAHMQESESGEVHIPDFEAPVVRELLHFMYTDHLTQDSTVPKTDLLRIATKYQVQGMMCLCENQLIQQVNEDCVVSLLQLADQQGAARLKRACLRFVAQNGDKVTKQRAFQELDQELKHDAMLVIDVLRGV